MNKVTGKITFEDSNLGIPNLLVVIYDVDSDTRTGEPNVEMSVHGQKTSDTPIEIQDEKAKSHFPEGLGDRIGSVLTDEKGEFLLQYEDDEFRIRDKNEQRPDLLLMVYSSEKNGKSPKDIVVFVSPEIRKNAGRTETYIIQIEEKTLKDLGISIPTAVSSLNAQKDSFLKSLTDDDEFNKEILKERSAKVKNAQKEIDDIRKEFRDASIPKLAINQTFTTFVAEGELVSEKSKGHIKNQLKKSNELIAKQISESRGMEVCILLNTDDKKDIDFSDPDGIIQLTSEKFKKIRDNLNAAGTNNLILTSDNPILKKCLTNTDEIICASKKLNLTAEEEIKSDEGAITEPESIVDSETPTAKEDIAKYVTKVLREIRMEQTNLNIPQRPETSRNVDDSIEKFSLKKGPAELPSYFDFQILQIAFGHIWQMLIDDEPAQRAAEAKKTATARGIDPSAIKNITSIGAFKNVHMVAQFIESPPPAKVIANFDITQLEWNALSPQSQQKLTEICDKIDLANTGFIHHSGGENWLGLSVPPGNKKVSTYVAEQFIQKQKEQGDLLIDYVKWGDVKTFHQILKDLDDALKSNYAFTIFGADNSEKSVNFGLLNTYRQKWEPVAYQVGDLIKSIPLSPKEEKKYSLKTTFNRKRSEKEARKNNTSITQEQNTTSRAEEEIVNKAHNKNDFKMGAEGSFSKWKISSSLGLEASKESQQNKKNFRESTIKAAQEFKEERSVEINTEESYSSEYTESGTIVNPNDELAVTYLFYELQKRFKVSEQLYRVMPVVLVAQDVPEPSEITEAWIIAHDWIFNRALLDDSFRTALNHISQKNVGDDFAIRELRKNMRTQRQLVEKLKIELSANKRDSENRYVALENSIKKRISEEEDRNDNGWFENTWEGAFGGDVEDPESAKAREMAARDAHAYAVEKTDKMIASLQVEVNALHRLTEDYNTAMREQLDKKTMVARLKTHIKNNIIYYMQQVWSLEHPEQRYMRLLNTQVPNLEFESITCELKVSAEEDLFAPFRKENETLHKAWVKAKLKELDGSEATTNLVEIADLDSFLGFMGNYMVFPMKLHNALTELMAMPYVDAGFGAMDPDQLSNVSLEDFARYVCCLGDELDKPENKDLKTALKKWYELLLADPLRNGDEIIVPTNSLYIEILTSANTMLEDFKLQHRAWDVEKVKEEVRMQSLENLRYAKRILMDELEDPKIDKKIIVEGQKNTSINPEI